MAINNEDVKRIFTFWAPGCAIVGGVFYILGLASLKTSIMAVGGVFIGANLSVIFTHLRERWDAKRQSGRDSQ